MLLSQLIGERYREKPVEASMASHIFMLRGGYMRQVASGIYSLLPPAKRITAKLDLAEKFPVIVAALGGLFSTSTLLLPCHVQVKRCASRLIGR